MSTQQQREQPYQIAQRLMDIADAAEGPKGIGVSPAFVEAVEKALDQARTDAIGEVETVIGDMPDNLFAYGDGLRGKYSERYRIKCELQQLKNPSKGGE